MYITMENGASGNESYERNEKSKQMNEHLNNQLPDE